MTAVPALPDPDEIDTLVQRELATLEVSGKLYQFKPESRCRICRDTEIKTAVNKMLAAGLTFYDILETLKPYNAQQAKNNQITQNSLYNHRTEHFAIDKAGVAVFRTIQEKRAQEYNQDFVEGTGTVINALSYLDTMQAKGYETLVNEQYIVDPVIGMQASVKLHELLAKQEGENEIAELRRKLNLFINAVKDTVPEKYFDSVVEKVELQFKVRKQEAIEAEVEEEQFGYEDEVEELDGDRDDTTGSE